MSIFLQTTKTFNMVIDDEWEDYIASISKKVSSITGAIKLIKPKAGLQYAFMPPN